MKDPSFQLLVNFGGKRLYAMACQFAADKTITVDQAARFLCETSDSIEYCIEEIDAVRAAIVKAIDNGLTVENVMEDDVAK